MKRTTKTAPISDAEKRGKLHGYRSGLEERIANELAAKGIAVGYESVKIKYVKPARESTYTPDWILPNGIVVESKGRFLTLDRQKHLLIKAQHGDKYDIRFVFSNSRQRISKQSKTTYASWCEKNGFRYADVSIPQTWLDEKAKLND